MAREDVQELIKALADANLTFEGGGAVEPNAKEVQYFDPDLGKYFNQLVSKKEPVHEKLKASIDKIGTAIKSQKAADFSLLAKVIQDISHSIKALEKEKVTSFSIERDSNGFIETVTPIYKD